MKREFVHVIQNVESTEVMNILGGLVECSVTEHANTVTIATQTLGGLSAIIIACLVNKGEKKINNAIRSLNEAVVEFIN